jgi:hypothetical protein
MINDRIYQKIKSTNRILKSSHNLLNEKTISAEHNLTILGEISFTFTSPLVAL